MGRGERSGGRTEVGFTCSVMLVLLTFILVQGLSRAKIMPGWWDWPWWLKLLISAVAIALLIGGGAYDKATRWPRVDLTDDAEKKPGSTDK